MEFKYAQYYFIVQINDYLSIMLNIIVIKIIIDKCKINENITMFMLR